MATTKAYNNGRAVRKAAINGASNTFDVVSAGATKTVAITKAASGAVTDFFKGVFTTTKPKRAPRAKPTKAVVKQQPTAKPKVAPAKRAAKAPATK